MNSNDTQLTASNMTSFLSAMVNKPIVSTTPKVKTKTITVYSDSQHGWAKVSMKEITKLGLENKISSFSYVNGDYIYLEEDCDLEVYLIALKNLGIAYKFNEHHTNRQSKIRNYPRYVKPMPTILFSFINK